MKSLLILLLNVCILIAAAAQTEKMNKEEFTKIFSSKMKENFNAHGAEPKGELKVLLIWTPAEGASTLFDIEESYKMYLDSEQDFDSQFYQLLSVAEEISDKDVDLTMDSPMGHEDGWSRILPVIKSQQWVYNAGVEDLHALEYNEDLAIVFAEDLPDRVNYLSESKLREYGLSGDTLMAIALHNFEENIFPSFTFELEEDESSFALYLDNVYESSLLLYLDDFWQNMSSTMEGDLVIMVPNRNFIAGTSTAHDDKIKRFKKFAKKYYNSKPYPVSPHLYTWNGDRFVRWEDN